MARTGNRRRPDRLERHASRRAFGQRLGRAFLHVTGLVALLSGLWLGGRAAQRALFSSRTFAVDDLEVTGAGRLTAAELCALSGLRLGVNVWGVDLDEAERLLLQDPWVRSAKVTRHPPRRLSLAVALRHAVAAIDLGGLYLVDEGGEVFKRALPADGVDLPLITGIPRRLFADRPAFAHAEMAAALSLLDELRRRHFAELSEVHCDELLGPTIYLGPGPLAVRLGEGDPAPKLDRLAQAEASLSKRGLRPAVLDLSDSQHPERVAVQLAGAEAEGAKHSREPLH